MAVSNRLKIAPVIEKGFADVLDAYSTFSTPTQFSTDLLLVQNLTDADVMFSFDDGATDNFPLASSSYLLVDLNQFVVASQSKIVKGTIIAARRLAAGVAPTAGSLWITIFYTETI